MATLAIAGIVAIVSATVLTIAEGARRTAAAPDAYTDAVGGDADATVVQREGRPLTEEVRALPGVASWSRATSRHARKNRARAEHARSMDLLKTGASISAATC
ncbi:MAG: hypothetical protein ACRDV7_00215 [Acidimicrobiia bacterium]